MGDTNLPPAPVSGGSNSTASVGSAVLKACEKIRARLLEAYQRTTPDLDPPDEAALLLKAGFPVSCYPGDAENLRVTSAEDLPVVEELLRRRSR